MKLSMRVKLASAVALLVMVLAGSAWGAATPGIKVEPTWNSSDPTKLTLKFTFYKDDKPFGGIFDILDATARTRLVNETSVRVNILDKNGDSIFTADENTGPHVVGEHSFSTNETYADNGVTAEFTLAKALTAGEYTIIYRTVWDDDESPSIFLEEPFKTLVDDEKFDGYEGVPANGGQLVSIGLTAPTTSGVVSSISDAELKADLEAVTDGDNADATVIASEPGIDSATVVTLPVFQTTVDPTSTYNYRRVVTLDDIAAEGYKVGDLAVIKIKPDGTTVKFDKVDPGEVADGKFSVATYSNVPLSDGDTIQAGIEYIFSIGIKDNGDYDWSTSDSNGLIIDPAGIGVKSGGGTGGGGCNVGGYGVIALLLAAVGLVTRKSRKA